MFYVNRLIFIFFLHIFYI